MANFLTPISAREANMTDSYLNIYEFIDEHWKVPRPNVASQELSRIFLFMGQRGHFHLR